MLLATLTLAGCTPTPTSHPTPEGELPPAYSSGQINDPKLAAVAREFTAWAKAQRAREQPLYGRVEVLPPAETLLPYGIGTYQKELRLPAILTTGPGWEALPPAEREEATATAFRKLTDQLTASSVKPTLTVQTPEGMELGWINNLSPDRKLLHGND